MDSLNFESQDFRAVYSEALTYGFQALGRQLSNVVNDYLTRKYHLSPIDTYQKPRILSEALEKSLGFGSLIVEKRIIKSIHSQLSLRQDEQPILRMGHPEDFEKYIFELKEKVSR